MAANQSPWPRAWLMTDERIGDRLWQAIEALPAGAGVVFRHYATLPKVRRSLACQIAEACRRQNLLLAVARDVDLAEELGADLVHNASGTSGLPLSMAVHDEQQAEHARRVAASLVFVGPVFPTRSHPRALTLGPTRGGELARLAGIPAIAIGGMDAQRFSELEAASPGKFHGFAGIDCWLSSSLRI